MTYVGDFPPCLHKFVNSNGIILCEWCGFVSRANQSLQTRINTAQGLLR